MGFASTAWCCKRLHPVSNPCSLCTPPAGIAGCRGIAVRHMRCMPVQSRQDGAGRTSVSFPTLVGPCLEATSPCGCCGDLDGTPNKRKILIGG